MKNKGIKHNLTILPLTDWLSGGTKFQATHETSAEWFHRRTPRTISLHVSPYTALDYWRELLLGRRPRSKLDFLKPNLAETVQLKVLAQKKNHDARTRSRTFNVDEKVYVKDFPSKKWVPGKVIEIRGPLSYLIQRI